jgi:chlorite dismutase
MTHSNEVPAYAAEPNATSAVPAEQTEQAAPEAHAGNEEQGEGTTLTEYTMISVFRRETLNELVLSGRDAIKAVDELDGIVAELAENGVKVRGFYDVSGFRHDGELMVWLHGEVPESLQWGLRQIRRSELIAPLTPSWQIVGVHRAAEFSARHMPAYMLGKEPRQWVTVYPFVRSYEWYLLPEDERRQMLAEHGRAGSSYTSTLTNTVAAFGISDYEWLLALEDDNLLNLVDMMRDLRQTDARRHVREEVPFYTGRFVQTSEIVEVLQ